MKFGGLGKTSSRLALAAAAGLFAGGIALTPAQAADLGGDCCADLEERVAELEATTVRKGNRKMSLKLSGQVNQAIMFWDDGIDSDVYVVDNGDWSSRWRMTGSAKISAGTSVGFNIEYEPRTALSYRTSATNQDGPNDETSNRLRQNHVWMKGSFGKITLGKASEATDGISEISTGYAIGSLQVGGHALDLGSFVWTDGTTRSTVTNFSTYLDLDGDRREIVRYDTPSFAGFVVSASWGEDDQSAIALRYAGEFGGVRVAAGVGYRDTEGTATHISGSASLKHVGSGVFISGKYGEVDNSSNAANLDDGTIYGGEIGIQKNFTGMGATTIAISYLVQEGNFTTQPAADGVDGVFGNDAAHNFENTAFGITLNQAIDAAGSTDVYINYRNYSLDTTVAATGAAGPNTENMSSIMAGMRVGF